MTNNGQNNIINNFRVKQMLAQLIVLHMSLLTIWRKINKNLRSFITKKVAIGNQTLKVTV